MDSLVQSSSLLRLLQPLISLSSYYSSVLPLWAITSGSTTNAVLGLQSVLLKEDGCFLGGLEDMEELDEEPDKVADELDEEMGGPGFGALLAEAALSLVGTGLA